MVMSHQNKLYYTQDKSIKKYIKYKNINNCIFFFMINAIVHQLTGNAKFHRITTTLFNCHSSKLPRVGFVHQR